MPDEQSTQVDNIPRQTMSRRGTATCKSDTAVLLCMWIKSFNVGLKREGINVKELVYSALDAYTLGLLDKVADLSGCKLDIQGLHRELRKQHSSIWPDFLANLDDKCSRMSNDSYCAELRNAIDGHRECIDYATNRLGGSVQDGS